MNLIHFEPAHVFALDVDLSHNSDAREELRQNPDVLERLRDHSWSLEHDGVVVACGGAVPRASGGVSWWIAASRAALSRPVELTRIVRRLLAAECREGVHYAHAKDREAARWLEALGFEHVGWEFGCLLYARGA